MFWQRYTELCKQKGQSPNAVCSQLGLSNAAVTHWKNGSVPRNSTLKTISEYFNVSVDYLLGRTDTPKEPTESGERNIVRIAGRDGSYFEKRLTDEQIKALKAMIEQLPEVPDDL